MNKIPHKNKISLVVNKVRKSRCCFAYKCTCKFGGEHIGTGWMGGDQKGCPELKVCIDLLNKITHKEYKEILSR